MHTKNNNTNNDSNNDNNNNIKALEKAKEDDETRWLEMLRAVCPLKKKKKKIRQDG